MADDDDDAAEGATAGGNTEANEDLVEAIQDLEEDLNELKELIDEHPDAAIKASLGAEFTKLQEAVTAMKTQLGAS